MSRMGAVSATEKVAAVKKYLSGKESHAGMAKEYGVSRSTFQKWLSNYQAMGEAGLDHRKGNQRYPESLKKDAVADYFSGQFGLKEICKKYQIRSRTQLEKWILLYNGHSTNLAVYHGRKNKKDMPVKDLEIQPDEALRKIDAYYNEFIGWAEEFELAPIARKRMILSQLLTKVELGTKYAVTVEINMSYKQFLELDREQMSKADIGA